MKNLLIVLVVVGTFISSCKEENNVAPIKIEDKTEYTLNINLYPHIDERTIRWGEVGGDNYFPWYYVVVFRPFNKEDIEDKDYYKIHNNIELQTINSIDLRLGKYSPYNILIIPSFLYKEKDKSKYIAFLDGLKKDKYDSSGERTIINYFKEEFRKYKETETEANKQIFSIGIYQNVSVSENANTTLVVFDDKYYFYE